MGDHIWPPLAPYLRESLITHSNGVRLLRAVQAHNNQTREVIQLLQWWVNEGDLDPVDEDPLEAALGRFEADLTVNSAGQESLLQRAGVVHNILFDWVMDSPLVQDPREAILCRTTPDVQAVHILSRLGVWPQRHLFRVGIDWTLPHNPVPPQHLAAVARALDCEVYNIQ